MALLQVHFEGTAIGKQSNYIEHTGAHNWDYWDEHIQETLPFVMEHVG